MEATTTSSKDAIRVEAIAIMVATTISSKDGARVEAITTSSTDAIRVEAIAAILSRVPPNLLFILSDRFPVRSAMLRLSSSS